MSPYAATRLPTTPFNLLANEREGLQGHLSQYHPEVAADKVDADMVAAHAACHPEVEARKEHTYDQGSHDRLLARLIDKLEKYRRDMAEGERLAEITKKWQKLTLDDFERLVLTHGPATGAYLAMQMSDLIPEAKAYDFDNARVGPKLGTLVDQGRIEKRRFGDLPRQTKRNTSGSYGTSDKTWVYGKPDQFTALEDEAEAIQAEQARRDEVFATVCSRLAERYEAGEIEGKIGKGRGSETVGIDVDFLAKVLGV